MSRLLQRLRLIEEKIAPKGRHFVFTHFVDGEPDAPSRDEQFAAFKAEGGLGPNDHIHTVTVTFS
jgi:hypothetical protein